MKNEMDFKNVPHHCLRYIQLKPEYKGKKDRSISAFNFRFNNGSDNPDCPNCKFREVKFCKSLLVLLFRWNRQLITKYDNVFGFQDRQDILQQTMDAMYYPETFERMFHSNKLKCTPEQYSGGIYKKIRDKHMRQYRKTIEYAVKYPPTNIDELCSNDLKAYFSWDSFENRLKLICYPLPHLIVNVAIEKAVFEICEDIDKEQRLDDWRKLMERFYRASRILITVPLNENEKGESSGDPIPIRFSNEQNEELIVVFSKSGTKLARECEELFNILFINGYDTSVTATTTGKSKRQILDKRKECYKLYWKTVMRLLLSIKDKRAIFCRKIFHNVEEFKQTLMPSDRKQTTVFRKFEEHLGLKQGTISNEIADCQKMVISMIEDGYV